MFGGCASLPVVTGPCLQMLPDQDRLATVHLVKNDQPVPDNNLLKATDDDPEALALARSSRKHAVAALPLEIGGILFTVAGVIVTADGGSGSSTRELAIGAPLIGVGLTAIVVGAIEFKKSSNRGLRAMTVYNDHHPECR
jgi:hypothetical protein